MARWYDGPLNAPCIVNEPCQALVNNQTVHARSGHEQKRVRLGLPIERALREIDFLLAPLANVRLVEFIRKNFLFSAAFGAFADKRF
jgi:hypothetical protein